MAVVLTIRLYLPYLLHPFPLPGFPSMDTIPFLGWWRGEDSNLRRHGRQIYSLFPLTAREPLLMSIHLKELQKKYQPCILLIPNALPGASEGIRTPDQLITNQSLYRTELRWPNSHETQSFYYNLLKIIFKELFCSCFLVYNFDFN
jgi:hypothetical protein